MSREGEVTSLFWTRKQLTGPLCPSPFVSQKVVGEILMLFSLMAASMSLAKQGRRGQDMLHVMWHKTLTMSLRQVCLDLLAIST